MYRKKIVFSGLSLPVLVMTHQFQAYQRRHRQDNEHETSRRSKLLAQPAENITPTNGANFLWSSAKDVA